MILILDPALLDENPEINLLVVNSLYHSEVFMSVIIRINSHLF